MMYFRDGFPTLLLRVNGNERCCRERHVNENYNSPMIFEIFEVHLKTLFVRKQCHDIDLDPNTVHNHVLRVMTKVDFL